MSAAQAPDVGQTGRTCATSVEMERASVNVGNSVRKAIDDWMHGELEAAMLHACNSVDGTAKKLYPKLGSTARFKRFLRESYDILGPMGAPGVNLRESRFPVRVPHPKANGSLPDLADIIYGVHRCTHGHGDELPDGFELLNDAAGPPRVTRMHLGDGTLQLSDRIIFGLVAAAVMSPANVGQSVPSGYFLTFGADAVLPINDWWGRAADFPAIAAMDPVPQVKFVFKAQA